MVCNVDVDPIRIEIILKNLEVKKKKILLIIITTIKYTFLCLFCKSCKNRTKHYSLARNSVYFARRKSRKYSDVFLSCHATITLKENNKPIKTTMSWELFLWRWWWVSICHCCCCNCCWFVIVVVAVVVILFTSPIINVNRRIIIHYQLKLIN